MTFYSQIATMPMILKMIPPFLLFLSYTFFFLKICSEGVSGCGTARTDQPLVM